MQVVLLPDDVVVGRHWNRLRCTADHSNGAWSASDLIKKPELKRCKHGAVVIVDGMPMCKIHAGFKLLKQVLDNGGVL